MVGTEVNGGRFRDNAARFGGALFGRPVDRTLSLVRFGGVEVRAMAAALQ